MNSVEVKPDPKNIKTVNGVRKLKRWTVLDVDEDVTIGVRQFARQNGYTSGKAVVILLEKALKYNLK